MIKLICELIIMSISGTVMYFLSLFFKGRKYAAPRYAMLIAAVAIMLIPFDPAALAPKILSVELPRETVYGSGYVTSMNNGISLSDIAVTAACTIWFAGAFISGIGIIKGYMKTSRVVKRVSKRTLDGRIIGIYESVCKTLSVKRGIDVCVSRHLRSPLLFGIVKPRIILPEREFTDAELEMIITHELVHYKHRDLWIALAASVVRCVHWFNPCAYLLGAAIAETRELCCDESVLTVMNTDDRKDYGRVIISVIEDGIKCNPAYTTAMASSKKCIRKRLVKIAHFKKPSRAARLTALAAVCACSAVSLTSFGFTQAAEAVPSELTHRMAEAVHPYPERKPEPPENRSIYEETPTPSGAASSLESAPEEMSLPQTSEPAAQTAAREEAEHIVYTFELDESEPTPDTAEERPLSSEAEAVSEEPSVPQAAERKETNPIPDPAAEPSAVPQTFTLPETAYIFTPDLSAGNELRSDNFYASEDITLSVSKSGDASIRLYDAATNDLIYDDSVSPNRSSFSIDMPSGSTYYITVTKGRRDDVSVYIKADE